MYKRIALIHCRNKTVIIASITQEDIRLYKYYKYRLQYPE